MQVVDVDDVGVGRENAPDLLWVEVGRCRLQEVSHQRRDRRVIEGIELQQRGFRPTVIPLDRAGVPTYDELALVASSARLRGDSAYRHRVGRFVTAFLAGEQQARAHPRRALGILGTVTASGAGFLARATPATLALLPGSRGIGCMRRPEWRRFEDWMVQEKLLQESVPLATVMTTSLLPTRCRA